MIIEMQGNRQAAVMQTQACGKCEYTEASVALSKVRGGRKLVSLFRSEDDAKEAYETARELFVKEAWNKAWAKFRCTNNACRNKDSCNAQVKYLIAHTEIVEDAKKRRRFKVEITVGREIRCVATAGNNLDPTIPGFEEYDGNAQVPEDLPPIALRPTRETETPVAFASILVADAVVLKGMAKASR